MPDHHSPDPEAIRAEVEADLGHLVADGVSFNDLSVNTEFMERLDGFDVETFLYDYSVTDDPSIAKLVSDTRSSFVLDQTMTGTNNLKEILSDLQQVQNEMREALGNNVLSDDEIELFSDRLEQLSERQQDLEEQLQHGEDIGKVDLLNQTIQERLEAGELEVIHYDDEYYIFREREGGEAYKVVR